MVVYPRWRGELNIGNGFAVAASGLSPLARGTPEFEPDKLRVRRFIPAGAGNTYLTSLIIPQIQVYPRWRGEHISALSTAISVSGLSPLARGTPRLGVRVGIIGRFIPAGAGNTPRAHIFKFSESVYPRWRGEHFRDIRYREREIGLSPLAWGTL